MIAIMQSNGKIKQYRVEDIKNVYDSAEKHRIGSNEGDSIDIYENNSPILEIRYYDRGKAKLYSIVRYEDIEDEVALRDRENNP